MACNKEMYKYVIVGLVSVDSGLVICELVFIYDCANIASAASNICNANIVSEANNVCMLVILWSEFGFEDLDVW